MFLCRLQKTWIRSMQREGLQVRRIMLYMLWETCVPSSFYQFICGPDNFLWIVTMYTIPKTTDIVSKYVRENMNNYREPGACFEKYFKIYRMYMLCCFQNFKSKTKNVELIFKHLMCFILKIGLTKKHKRVNSPGKSA